MSSNAPTRRRALFLDRDGVVNEDAGYVHRPQETVFIDGVFELARAAAGANFLTVIVTNQSGIGRGRYDEAQFNAYMRWMRAKFARAGATLAAVYHAPFHPEAAVAAYRRDSVFRKPAPGMFLRAAADHGLDLAASVAVGDQARDAAAARAAGVGTVIQFDRSGGGSPDDADEVCADLRALAKRFSGLGGFARRERG